MTNQEPVTIETIDELKKSMKDAQDILEKGFHDIFDSGRKDAEEKSNKKELDELCDLDKELAGI